MENTFGDCFFLPSTEEVLPLVAQNDQALASMSTKEQLQPARNLEDSDIVPSSLLDITPILRVANEVEPCNSRIAYLCRFYAFEQAHKLDPTSTGPGVRQFKTALLHRLEREDSQSCFVRGTKSDAREMQSFYRHYTTTYIPSLQNSADKAHSAQLTEAYQTLGVLFEVLKAVNLADPIETDSENLKSNVEELPVCDIEEKMMVTDEKWDVVAKNYPWDYFFPAEEVLNPPLPLDSENEQ